MGYWYVILPLIMLVHDVWKSSSSFHSLVKESIAARSFNCTDCWECFVKLNWVRRIWWKLGFEIIISRSMASIGQACDFPGTCKITGICFKFFRFCLIIPLPFQLDCSFATSFVYCSQHLLGISHCVKMVIFWKYARLIEFNTSHGIHYVTFVRS